MIKNKKLGVYAVVLDSVRISHQAVVYRGTVEASVTYGGQEGSMP